MVEVSSSEQKWLYFYRNSAELSRQGEISIRRPHLSLLTSQCILHFRDSKQGTLVFHFILFITRWLMPCYVCSHGALSSCTLRQERNLLLHSHAIESLIQVRAVGSVTHRLSLCVLLGARTCTWWPFPTWTAWERDHSRLSVFVRSSALANSCENYSTFLLFSRYYDRIIRVTTITSLTEKWRNGSSDSK